MPLSTDDLAPQHDSGPPEEVKSEGDLASTVAEAQAALSSLSYDQSQILPDADQLDNLVSKLQAVIKAAKAHKKSDES